MDPIKSGQNWYVYCENNPLKYFDPDGLSTWLKVPGAKNYWYRHDPPAGFGDNWHYHFGKGKDPRSPKFKQFNRRVYQVQTDDGYNIDQRRHGGGKGGKGGLNQDVPEDVIRSVLDRGGNNAAERVTLPNTFWGFGPDEYFDVARVIGPEEGLGLFGDNYFSIAGGNTLTVYDTYYRNRETGNVTIITSNYLDPITNTIAPIAPGLSLGLMGGQLGVNLGMNLNMNSTMPLKLQLIFE